MARLISVESGLTNLVRGRPSDRGSLRSSGRFVPFRCRLRRDDSNSGAGKEPLEELFAKELKRRGINSASSSSEIPQNLLSSIVESDLEEERIEGGDPLKKKRVAWAHHRKRMTRSLDLNSDHLEGLIPRAKLILRTSTTLFLGFWPLILITMGIFSAMDHYFGPGLAHRAQHTEVSGPTGVGPRHLPDARTTQHGN
ncbi:uncharacterized protein LOC144707894 [Wolffia australiana]